MSVWYVHHYLSPSLQLGDPFLSSIIIFSLSFSRCLHLPHIILHFSEEKNDENWSKYTHTRKQLLWFTRLPLYCETSSRIFSDSLILEKILLRDRWEESVNELQFFIIFFPFLFLLTFAPSFIILLLLIYFFSFL